MPHLQIQNDSTQIVDVDYVLADVWRDQQYQSRFQKKKIELNEFITFLDSLISQGRYGIFGIENGVILLQKQIVSQPEATSDWLKLREEIQR